MIEVKQNSNFANSMIASFNYCKDITDNGIYGLYARPSCEKQRTYRECIERAKYYGTVVKVKGSGNCHFYTLYILVDCGSNKRILIKETVSNTYILQGVEL